MNLQRLYGSSTPKALFACGVHWNSPIRTGSHHIANALADMGWAVAYVSDPISPLHALGGVDFWNRLSITIAGGRWVEGKNIWTYVPFAAITPQNKPFMRSNWVQQNWQRLTFPRIIQVIAGAGFASVDLLYLDSFSQTFWLDQLTFRKSVFRIVDHLSSYPKSTPVFVNALEKAAQRVDLVVYPALTLKPYIQNMRPRQGVHIPNGLNSAAFLNGDRTPPEEYQSIPQPIALYVGAMDVWFDYELITQAAQQLPDVSFVMVGPNHMAKRRLPELHNLYLLGPKPHNQLSRYIYNAQVGLIPFDLKNYPELVNGIHPLKLYEYFACGLPVAAMGWNELRNLNSPVMLCDTQQDFVQAIRAGINNPGSPQQRIRFVSNADWKHRVQSILDTLHL